MQDKENANKKSFIKRYWWIGVIITGVIAVGIFIPKLINNNIKADNTPTLLIKSLPVNIEEYNPETNMAGDFLFTKEYLYNNKVFHELGEFIAETPDRKGKLSPQVSFALPVGTKIRAMADGEVFNITKLYSNDYGILILIDKKNSLYAGHEHVVNPLVKVGDKVKAGQIIAEVGTHGTESNSNKLGIVEFDILKSSGEAANNIHLCPFLYLDPNVKSSILNKVIKLMVDWEDYKNDNSIYDETKQIVPGCLYEKLSEKETIS